MEFYNQTWFWAGISPVIASLGGILIRELISTRSQAKLERLKLYESDVFKAYKSLYQFTSSAYSILWPPNEPRENYIELMRRSYFKNVKSSMLFFHPEIREILGKLESQYDCLWDPDMIPEKSFDEFYDNELPKLLGRLDKAVKKRIDLILHK